MLAISHVTLDGATLYNHDEMNEISNRMTFVNLVK